MTVVIRPYRKSDWQSLCEIHDPARRDELGYSVGTEAFETLEQAYVEDGLFDNALDVAEIDSKAVGFIAYSPSEITWLYVSPDHYRKGIGRALLQHALQNASNNVTLEVLEGNFPALTLYESLGFRFKERVEGKLSSNEDFPAIGLILQLSANPDRSD